jgi:hypothetical protein
MRMKNMEKDNRENKEWWRNKLPENNEWGINKKNDSSEKFSLSKLKAEIVSNQEKNEANRLVEEFNWVKKGTTEKTKESITTSIHQEISQLNRPEEVKKWLEQSYAHIEETIKNSPDDKNWFASIVWKAMNGILNW